MTMTRHIPRCRQQSGAVLYVALIMLVLLALIGVVALQIASLQERMSSNYQSTNIAFQNAEAGVRERELLLDDQLLQGINPTTNIPSRDCTTAFDPQTWESIAPHVRRMDECFSSGGVDMTSLPEEERTDQIYQITSYERDRPAAENPTAEAVINTVYIP
jgi:type IV pilus assembly protein PilX